MTEEDKKKKFARLLDHISHERKSKNKKDLSEHEIYIQRIKKQASLFDKLLFKAILEQAEGLSLAFTKPHSYRPEQAEVVRISKEAYETLEKAAILRPTKLGPLTLIS